MMKPTTPGPRRVRIHPKQVCDALGGLIDFQERGDVTTASRQAVLDLHCHTNARFSDQLADLIRMMRPPRPAAPASGFLGALSIEDQGAIVEQISRDGFYIFDRPLPTDLCDDLEGFARKAPAVLESSTGITEKRVYDPASPLCKTYHIYDEDCVQHQGVQRLMADRTMLAIAEMFLQSHPMIFSSLLWWSTAFGDKPGLEAAQEFHFDFDPPPLWLHFFIYLVDVGPDNGPHVYVRGSHKSGVPAAAPLLARNYVRIPDEDIIDAYGAENVVELQGKRGTIMAVCTRGFHKGKMLTRGHRLMSQTIFSMPPFSGGPSRKRVISSEIHPDLRAAMDENPETFQRYL